MSELLGIDNQLLSEFGEMGAIQESIMDLETAVEGLGNVGDIGAIRRPVQRLVKTTQAVAQQNKVLRSNASHPDRAAFEARLGMFPQDIREGLKNKRLQAVEAFYFNCKEITGNIIDMFKDSDNKDEGTCMLNGGKLDTGTHMILTGIMLLKGTKEDNKSVGEIVYDVIPSGIRNGEIEMIANTGSFILPRISMEIFDTSDMTNVRKGVYMLRNPKYLKPEQPLNLRIYLPKNYPTGQNEYLKIGLLGVATHKY